MKPAAFSFKAPESLQEALSILAEHGPDAKILAGGQSLIPAMNFRVTSPSMLVDLNKISELDYIRRDANGSLHIGAMTRQRAVERSDQVRQECLLLAEAMPHVAHPQIRNRGTVGGSLVHADPAAELPVVMVALDATFVLQSARGERSIPARDFFTGMFTVDAWPDEILTEIVLPPKRANSGCAFMEVARRQGDYAMMGLAAVVDADDAGTCVSAKLVYLNAGDKPVDAPDAEASLIGKTHDGLLIAGAADIASRDEIDPAGNIHASAAYQRHLAKVLTIRALNLAFERLFGASS